MQIADLEVDWQNRHVTRQSKELPLGNLNFEVFRLIVEAYPETVSPDDLRSAWPAGHVSEETLAKRITLLRQALDDPGRSPRYIETVRGRGYRLKTAPQHSPKGPTSPPDLQDRSLAGQFRKVSLLGTFLVAAVVALWIVSNLFIAPQATPPQFIEFNIPADMSRITAKLVPASMKVQESLVEINETGSFVLIAEKIDLPQSAGRQLDFLAQELEALGSPAALEKASLLRSALQRIHFGDYQQDNLSPDKPITESTDLEPKYYGLSTG